VNSQGATRDELVAHLSSAVREAVGMSRADAIAAAAGAYEVVEIGG